MMKIVEKPPLKQLVMESIERLPDDCSIDDIMYRLYVIDKVLKGIEDAESGRVITTEDLLKRVERFRK